MHLICSSWLRDKSFSTTHADYFYDSIPIARHLNEVEAIEKL